jgi:hypothetical protein
MGLPKEIVDLIEHFDRNQEEETLLQIGSPADRSVGVRAVWVEGCFIAHVYSEL